MGIEIPTKVIHGVHLVIGLYGMIVEDVTIWSDGDKAMEYAKELCDGGYEAIPRHGSSFDQRLGQFYAMSDNEENEVHIFFDMKIDPKPKGDR